LIVWTNKKGSFRISTKRTFIADYFLPDPAQHEQVSDPPRRNWKYPFPLQYGH